MKKYLLLGVGVICLLGVLGPVIPGAAQDVVKIGVLAKDGVMTCLEMWDYHAYYLSERVGRDIEIRPLDFYEVKSSVAAKQVHFLLVNSGMFVELESQYGLTAIATMLNSRKGFALDYFGGVVFVHKENSVKTLEDIAGKEVLAVSVDSFGGYQTQMRLLKKIGVTPAGISFAGSHGNVIRQVLLEDERTLVGMIRTDALERLAMDQLSDLRVISSQNHDDFPFFCSTVLYPEWPMAALEHTEPEFVREVAKALLEMKEEPGPLSQRTMEYAKIEGWVAPADYTEVRKCLNSLREVPDDPTR